MIVCLGIFLVSSLNIYAYADLGKDPGIWCNLYSSALLISFGLFFWLFIVTSKTVIEKPILRRAALGIFVWCLVGLVIYIRSCNSAH
jgi:hypothetical protein